MFDIKKAKEQENFREIKKTRVHSKFIEANGKTLLNLGSNDYLGIATNVSLKNEFLEICKDKDWFFGSGASRLVYSANEEFDKLESWFETKFGSKKAVIFNSGYCANLSCISALNGDKTLFLADKLVHASMIDALKLASANFKRFAHNDNEILEDLVKQNSDKFDHIIILTEAVFSMDGDSADIEFMVNLKKTYQNVLIYVDEAHSFFVKSQLGLSAELGLDKQIDFLLVTLGKGIGSSGAVMISSNEFKDIFVNSARSLIFSTAIPAINVAWTNFILSKDHSVQRANLKEIITFLGISDSHISPFIVGENKKALALSQKLFEAGYFVPAIRPPTVPLGKSRLRISLRGDILSEDLLNLKEILDENRSN
ncbi:aminotransferase class I/II-fold pyridoxal phosphate-dependent enzyme [Campylobacter hyointestinalis]|uniref:aminotransferase class I/II-fold pyridoxal phosphate-dependent enzyme n=1 Tax=Campylobacter hyointestinalis TaxID=198 RepID=UPI000CE33C4C|nr:aminotransferase class I/II-fold pyridoxal phosphate-dependent enzyme [Campylobacter hyointestinalis]PPB53902.1 8-amino-7-oxononanoate synthase [Campylobacter hyointestinalis subsp. hyointestinalis]